MSSQHIDNVIGDIFNLDCKNDIISTNHEIKSGMSQIDIERAQQIKMQISNESDFLNEPTRTSDNTKQQTEQAEIKSTKKQQHKQTSKPPTKQKKNQQHKPKQRPNYDNFYEDNENNEYDEYDEKEEAYYRDYEKLYDIYYNY